MRKTIVVFFTAALLLVNYGFSAQKRAIDKLKYPELNRLQLPEIFKGKTGNGIQLRLIRSDHLPLIGLKILVRGGGVYVPTDKVALDDITAEMLRIGGTRDLKPEQVDQMLDSMGISISVNAGPDFFSVNLSCLRENLDQAIGILARMLRQPGFDAGKIDEIKTRMGSAISRRNDTPSAINSREFNKLIYGEGSPFAGVLEYEHLDNISRDDVSAFYRRFFAPGNMLAGIVGPVDMKELEEVFEKHFGDWNHRPAIPGYPQVKVPEYDFKVAFAEKSNINQSHISIGHLGVKEDLAEMARIKIFNLIFSESFDSRLFTRVRTKMGLTYGVGGGIQTPHLYPGKTYFTTFTKSASTLKAIKAIFDEIDIIRREKVTPQELSGAKDYFINSFVFEYSSPEKILSSEMEREFYGLPEGYAQKLVEEIKLVTAEQVLAAARKYLQPEKMLIFVVGKEKDLDGKLSDLGQVKYVDISIKPPALKEKIPTATPEMLEKGKQLIASLFKNKYKGYENLKSLQTASAVTMSMPQGNFDLNIETVTLFPDKRHIVTSIMGIKIETVMNGDKGIIRQMGQERPMPEDQMKNQAFGSFYDMYHSPEKYSFQYLKEETIEGKAYDVVYVFDADKNWQKMFINKQTGLVEIEEKMSRIPGVTGVSRELNFDYKTVMGIPFSHRSESYVNDKKVISATLKEVKVNPKVDPALFKIEESK